MCIQTENDQFERKKKKMSFIHLLLKVSYGTGFKIFPRSCWKIYWIFYHSYRFY